MRSRVKPFNVTARSLIAVSIFAELDEPRRERLARCLRGLTYRAREEIISERDPSQDVFFILAGRVKVAVYSRSGREVIFRDLLAGQMFGELAALDGLPRSAQVRTLEETTIAVMSPADFQAEVIADPSVVRGVLLHLGGLVRALSDRVFETDALTVNSRVHHYLLRHAETSGGDGGNRAEIRDLPTREAIAHELGTTRFAISKELTRMERMGLVRRRGRHLLVEDVGALRQLCEMS